MTHKNYSAKVKIDAEDRIFVGRLVGIDDIAIFHGSTVKKLEIAFHETVVQYIEVNERTGRPAQKPYYGNLTLRVRPETRAASAIAAKRQGKSGNQWVTEVLERTAQYSAMRKKMTMAPYENSNIDYMLRKTIWRQK